MVLLQLSPSSWHRETVPPIIQTAKTNSSSPFSYYQQSPLSEDLKEEGQILGNILQIDVSQIGPIKAPSGDDRLIIDLTSDSEDDSDDQTEGSIDEDNLSIVSPVPGSLRLPLADLTHVVRSTVSLVLPTFEESNESLPSIPFFKVFEGRCKVDLIGDRGKNLTAAPNIRNSTDTLTRADSISFGMEYKKRNK